MNLTRRPETAEKVDRLYRQLGWTREPSIAETEARIRELERELEALRRESPTESADAAA